MKYPIDHLTAEQFFGHLIAHHRALETQVSSLTRLLMEAMSEMGMEDTDWFTEAKDLIKNIKSIERDHELRIFNESNGHGTPQRADTEIVQKVTENAQKQFTPEQNAMANQQEKSFGEEMSEDDLAAYFKEKRTKKKEHKVNLSKKDPFAGMSLDEIQAWEAEQDNSNDLYKVKARVMNLARASTGGTVTPVGEILVNTYVHVLMDFYKYAATLDKDVRYEMTQRIRKHEDMPGKIIAASTANVKVKKNDPKTD